MREAKDNRQCLKLNHHKNSNVMNLFFTKEGVVTKLAKLWLAYFNFSDRAQNLNLYD